jgi:thymidylate kinase
MSKYIICEGCDGNGKSSLVEWISKTYGYKLYKEQMMYKDRLASNYNGYFYYKDLVKNLPNNSVIDRFHIGEAVNPIIRKDGRNPLTMDQIISIEEEIKNQTFLITCITEEEVVKKTFETRGEDVAKIEDIKYLNYLYGHFHNLSSIKNKFIFDYMKDKNYDNIKTKIDYFMSDTLQEVIMI